MRPYLVVFLVLALCAAPARAGKPATKPRVTLNLKETPLLSALDLLFAEGLEGSFERHRLLAEAVRCAVA